MTLLERYEQMATPLEDARLPEHVKASLRRGRELEAAGIAPKAAYGPFRQMVDGAVVLGDQTAVTGTSEAALFPTSQYAGFAANQLRAGQKWKLTCYGKISTAGSSQGNITITPRFGTTTGGTSLVASTATALVASASNKLWQLWMYFTVRSVGLAGANSSVIANGVFMTDVAVIAAATGQIVPFGTNASVSVDLSIAAGLFIGITMGSASDSITCQDVILESLN